MPVVIQAAGGQELRELLRQARGEESDALLGKIFGGDAAAAADALVGESEELLRAVAGGAGRRAAESLEARIQGRSGRPGAKPPAAPATKPDRSPRPKPDVRVTETDKEIKATGEAKKSFETKEAKRTRTQRAETRYVKDGKTFGVETKDTQIIEAVSKADGKSFRREISMAWGAEVAACPDADGVSAGTGRAHVVSKTVYAEGGAPVTMTSEFDLQAKLTGRVNDDAVLTHYDLQLDAYGTNSGYEEALGRNIVKEMKIKDGRYGLRYDIPGNTVEVSDGTYGGKRTPAKMGQATASKLTPMSDADTALVGKALGSMVPAVWNSANEMYKSAERSWKNYGCVEVVCRAAKLRLKPGEEVAVSAETVHLAEGGKVNARLNAEAYGAQVTPETQQARPAATFNFTRAGDESASLHVESVSKRGIGRGDVEFRSEEPRAGPGPAPSPPRGGAARSGGSVRATTSPRTAATSRRRRASGSGSRGASTARPRRRTHTSRTPAAGTSRSITSTTGTRLTRATAAPRPSPTRGRRR